MEELGADIDGGLAALVSALAAPGAPRKSA